MDMTNDPLPTLRTPEPLLGTRVHEGLAQRLMDDMRSARRIADRAVIEDIESYGVAEKIHGATWYDIRPMVSRHEQPAENVDMALEALQYAASRGLIVHRPGEPHLVRIARG